MTFIDVLIDVSSTLTWSTTVSSEMSSGFVGCTLTTDFMGQTGFDVRNRR